MIREWSALLPWIADFLTDNHLDKKLLNDGQRRILVTAAHRLKHHGVLIADEVGLGKTRIACALAHAVCALGGRVAIVVPRGLMTQWQIELRLFPGKSALDAVQLAVFSDALDQGSLLTRPQCFLVSHGFRFHQVKSTSHEVRFCLPAMVEHVLATKHARVDRPKKIASFAAEFMRTNPDGFNRYLAAASHIAGRVASNPELISKITSLPLPYVDGSKEETSWPYRDKGYGFPGAAVAQQLLGQYIGHVDLLIIDEAHKSRDDRSILGEILNKLLLTRPALTRVVGLTATPMELSSRDWQDTLKRIRIAEATTIMPAIETFQKAMTAASIHPDESQVVDDLVKASTLFTEKLRPYVLRRLQRHEPLYREYISKLPAHIAALPHPHRKIDRIAIDLMIVPERWRRILVAMEGISKAASGIPAGLVSHRLKLVFTKLASGYINFDTLVNNLDADDREDLDALSQIGSSGETLDTRTNAKLRRVDYWRREILAALQEGNESQPDEEALREHPRIAKAIEIIEHWVLNEGEKVLVFGVFTQPLKVLDEILNVRQELRCVDSGKPVLAQYSSLHELECSQLRRAGQFSGTLKAECNATELKRLITAAHSVYETGRRKLSDYVDDEFLKEKLKGLKSIQEMERAALGQHLRLLMMDEIVGEHRSVADLSKADVTDVANSIWKGFSDALFEREAVAEESPKKSDQVEFREQRLRAWLKDTATTRRGQFSRFMYGSTPFETRNALKAGFNRKSGFPRILIGQSRVAREGLNLHESCRIVVQFHPEWNPAIVEQQIGRVDRLGSLWATMAEDWLHSPSLSAVPPVIQVQQIVFGGTYDDFQWGRVEARQKEFDASLFGNLLSPEAWAKIAPDAQKRLLAAAPDFDVSEDSVLAILRQFRRARAS